MSVLQDDATSCSDSESELSIHDDIEDDCYLIVSSSTVEPLTEQDKILHSCEALAKLLRDRPTLPASMSNKDNPLVHRDLPVRLPLYHCPFKGCSEQWESRQDFIQHFVLTNVDESTFPDATSHGKIIDQVCGTSFSWMTHLDYIAGAVAFKERQRWPDAGFGSCTTQSTTCCQTLQ